LFGHNHYTTGTFKWPILLLHNYTDLTLAITTIIIQYNKEEKVDEGLLVLLPVASFLMVIKNSSIFFVIINAVLFIYFMFKKNGIDKRSFLFAGLSLGVPYAFSYLWSQHVSFMFPSGLEAKHSMSLENYESIFQEKTPEDVQLISELFYERMIDIEAPDVKILLFLIVIFLGFVAYKLVLQKNIMDELKLISLMVLTYIVYQLSLWAMYLLSMPLNEALVLASYSRYSFTIIIYLYGLLGIYLLQQIESNNYSYAKYHGMRILAFSLILIMPIVMRNRTEAIFDLASFEQKGNPVRNHLRSVIENEEIPDDAFFNIYISDNDWLNQSGILTFVSRYELRTTEINIVNEEGINEVIPSQNSYLLLLERDDIVEQFLTERNSESSRSLIYLGDFGEVQR
jgi:hypothetical protein